MLKDKLEPGSRSIRFDCPMSYPRPAPEIEARRLRALADLRILDTEQSPAFDRLCRLACQVFAVPVALVSLIDEDRQWFKAACGLSPDLTETPRDQAFCNYTILNREVFVVHDALADARFASNPLVTGSVNIRFYAGAPLNLGPDIRVGSLCLIDTKPRAFELEQVAILKQFARVVVDEIWLHRIMTTGQADDIEQNRDELDFDLAPVHTGAQIRAARALLRWSADRLARLAGVALNTVKRIEAHDGPPPVRPETLDAVARALSDNGVEWVFAPNRQAGARLGNAAPMGSLGEFAPPTERREPR